MKDTAEMKTYIEKLKESYCFHDSFVFSAKLKGNDYVVYIETYEDHDWEKCACVKITFKNVDAIPGRAGETSQLELYRDELDVYMRSAATSVISQNPRAE